MKLNPTDSRLGGVWSATPTPLTADLQIDHASIRRMVERHVKLRVNGLFIGGTCGEGAWLTAEQNSQLLESVTRFNAGRMLIAAQVTDNSAARILDNINRARTAGADIALIASPHFLLNGTLENLESLYLRVLDRSRLPIGIYDRGRHGAIQIPIPVLERLLRHQNVVMLKDSSGDPERRERIATIKRYRPELCLLSGDEFSCPEYLRAGYDGLLLGGAILTARCAGEMIRAVKSGDEHKLERLQKRMSRLLLDVYGGPKITCWLSGLKHSLVEMNVFKTDRNILNYPLTTSCRRAIKRAIQRDADILFPAEK